MSSIILFGTGSFGEVAYQYFTSDSDHEVVAFTADDEYVSEGEQLFETPVIPFAELTNVYPPEKYDMFVALTYTDLNRLRESKYDAAKEKGYNLVSYVSSDSIVWDSASIGENCFVFENQTIQPFVNVGDNVILWSGNHVGHHSTIRDHTFVSSHVVISGHVTVGKYSFLGVNSTISDGVSVAKDTLVGANALIRADTEPGSVHVGPESTTLDRESKDLL